MYKITATSKTILAKTHNSEIHNFSRVPKILKNLFGGDHNFVAERRKFCRKIDKFVFSAKSLVKKISILSHSAEDIVRWSAICLKVPKTL